MTLLTDLNSLFIYLFICIVNCIIDEIFTIEPVNCRIDEIFTIEPACNLTLNFTTDNLICIDETFTIDHACKL